MHEKKKIGFVYTVEHIGVDGKVKSREVIENIIPTAGLNYILSAALADGEQYSSWYIGLFTANRTPLAEDTLTTLLADCQESSDYEDGTYRLEAVFPTIADGAVTTVADPTIFSFDTGATIQGGFLASNSIIGNDSGVLISAIKFSSPKVIAAGELLRVPVGIAMASS